MKKLIMITIVMLILAFVSSSIMAAETGKSIIRFGLQYVAPTGSKDSVLSTDIGGAVYYEIPAKVEPDTGIGFSFYYEYMFTDMVGFEADLSYSKHDADMTFHGNYQTYDADGAPLGDPIPAGGGFDGSIDLMPLCIGVNFHPVKKEKVDFYFGPFISYISYSDLKLKNGKLIDLDTDESFDLGSLTVKIKNDFGYGAAFGIDVPFGSNGWMFSSQLKYMGTKAKVDEPGVNEEIKINPWILQLGVGYQF